MSRHEKQTSLLHYYIEGYVYYRLDNLIFFDGLLLHKLVAI